jgi:hypothetical protein
VYLSVWGSIAGVRQGISAAIRDRGIIGGQAPVLPAPSKKGKAKGKRDDDSDDEIPKAKQRKRDDDDSDDEIPKAMKKRDDDDSADEIPKAKKRKEDDSDHDLDSDSGDDRPRRKK